MLNKSHADLFDTTGVVTPTAFWLHDTQSLQTLCSILNIKNQQQPLRMGLKARGTRKWERAFK